MKREVNSRRLNYLDEAKHSSANNFAAPSFKEFSPKKDRVGNLITAWLKFLSRDFRFEWEFYTVQKKREQ